MSNRKERIDNLMEGFLSTEPRKVEEGMGSARIIMLDVTKLNKHNFYFMKRRLDMVTENMLEVSKKLQEVAKLTRKIEETHPEDDIIGYIAGDVEAMESRFDKWMMNQEEE